MDGISFDKGCYHGQELIARTHFKGVIRRRIMPLHISYPTDGVPAGSTVLIGDSASPCGKVLCSQAGPGGTAALASLKVSAVLSALPVDATQEDTVQAQCNTGSAHVDCAISLPRWLASWESRDPG